MSIGEQLPKIAGITVAAGLAAAGGAFEWNYAQRIGEHDPTMTAANDQAVHALDVIDDREATLACIEGLSAPVGELIIIASVEEGTQEAISADCLERITTEAETSESHQAYGFTAAGELFVVPDMTVVNPGQAFNSEQLRTDLALSIESGENDLREAQAEREDIQAQIDDIKDERRLTRVGLGVGAATLAAVALWRRGRNNDKGDSLDSKHESLRRDATPKAKRERRPSRILSHLRSGLAWFDRSVDIPSNQTSASKSEVEAHDEELTKSH